MWKHIVYPVYKLAAHTEKDRDRERNRIEVLSSNVERTCYREINRCTEREREKEKCVCVREWMRQQIPNITANIN